MPIDQLQPISPPRRRLPTFALLILAIAVVALGVSLTDQMKREQAPTPVFIHQSGTPATEQLSDALTGENSPPDLLPLTDGEESDFAVAAVANVQPAVITVQRSSERALLGTDASTDGAVGSGVIISDAGYAIASLRTTGTDGDLQVVFADGGIADADVVAVDEAFQLVLLKIDGDVPAVAPMAGYSPLPGERVLAIGSALDSFFSTVTSGVISSSGATMPAEGNWLPVRGVLQHDAAINEGNEGGPLFDLNGNVIGINIGNVTTSGDEPAQGWSFAVPISSLSELINAVA
ncbi:MAG: S1C family serine protease [Thermomicrobiales bacterium]